MREADQRTNLPGFVAQAFSGVGRRDAGLQLGVLRNVLDAQLLARHQTHGRHRREDGTGRTITGIAQRNIVLSGKHDASTDTAATSGPAVAVAQYLILMSLYRL